MKALKLFIAATFTFITTGMDAQRHEVGVQAGMANLVGDIGRTNYVFQKPFGNISKYGLPIYLGIMYKMNFNPYQGLRFNAGYANIQFRDQSAKELYRKNRGLEGLNSVYNVDAQYEYNFFPINEEQKGMWSPYIFGGLGAIVHSTKRATLDFSGRLYENEAGDLDVPEYPYEYPSAVTERGNTISLSIPFGAGLKYKFNYNWALFGEFKFRYTFTDAIDYSRIDDRNVRIIGKVENLTEQSNRRLRGSEQESLLKPYIAASQIGNGNSNDWVNSVTLGVSYSFGRPPCYCENRR